MVQIVPVNPAEFIGDIVVKEGLWTTPKSVEAKEELFRQVFAQTLLGKGIFSTEYSIFKPEPEDNLMGNNNYLVHNTYFSHVLSQELVNEYGLFDSVEFSKK